MDALIDAVGENESSDEEFLKPALPVVVPEDECLDESKRYLDPNNYLLYVRNEAAKYPATLTAPRNSEDSLGDETVDDYEKNNEEIQVSLDEVTGIKSFLRDFPISWLQCQAENFITSQKEFRFAVDVLLPSQKLQSTSVNISDLKEFVKALSLKDSIEWFSINPVKLSYFIDLPQEKLTDLLEELVPQCLPSEWKSDLQAWLYAALLALEKPLHPNTCSLLRNIAEQFCEHLQVKEYTEGTESEEKRFCYVILSIIGFAFGQRDIIENL